MAELCFSQAYVSKLLLKLRVSCLGALYLSSCFEQVYRLRGCVCQYVQARPWFRPSTWVSSVAGIGFVSCSLYKLLYFARMTKHSVWHRLSVVFIPTVRIENPVFLLAIQKEPTVKCGFRSFSV